MSAQTDMKVISVLLDEAMEQGLEVEVIYAALKTMREEAKLPSYLYVNQKIINDYSTQFYSTCILRFKRQTRKTIYGC